MRLYASMESLDDDDDDDGLRRKLISPRDLRLSRLASVQRPTL